MKPPKKIIAAKNTLREDVFFFFCKNIFVKMKGTDGKVPGSRNEFSHLLVGNGL
jgi:hypothetical protein